jgi:hypothetical protein
MYMVDEEPSVLQAGIGGRFVGRQSMLAVFTALTLLASNVASVVSSSAHDWMHNAMWQVLSIGGQSIADRALAHSPKKKLDQSIKSRTADLETRNKQLETANVFQAKQLDAANAKNRKLAQQLEVNGRQARETVAAVHKRLTKGVGRNLAALPSEAVPYLGIGVTLAVTSLDIYDACQTMKDFNALLRMMGQGEQHPELCGQKVPTVDQVLAKVKTEWHASVQRVADESNAFKVTPPEVRLPTGDEVAKASCAAAEIRYLCPK